MEASGELLGRARAQAGKFSIMKISWILSTLELSDDTKKMKTNLLLMTTQEKKNQANLGKLANSFHTPETLHHLAEQYFFYTNTREKMILLHKIFTLSKKPR